MAFVAHGLKCESCDYKEAHVFYKKTDGPPACPTCGGARSIDWSHGKCPGVKGDGYGSFKTIDMGHLGVCETREQYDRAIGQIKQRYPGKELYIRGDSPQQRKQLADEARHRVWAKRKREGVDAQMRQEMKAKSKSLTLEQPGKKFTVTKDGVTANDG
jgi:hypothetical protein